MTTKSKTLDPRYRSLFVQLLSTLLIVTVLGLAGCSKQGSEPVATTPPPPPPPGAAFAQLQVVNDEPFPDMFFRHYGVNPTIDTAEEPRSTFSVDVDTSSYSIARAYLERQELPPAAAIRVEEFVNSFDYQYPDPQEDILGLQAEAFPSPHRRGYHVLHVGLQAKHLDPRQRKAANLVFVIDVSGSMDMENRLGLVKRSLHLLLQRLDERDTVGLVVYGTTARSVLEPTNNSHRIRTAIDRLHAEGSTNAEAGLELGYEMASRQMIPGGINRVILCSDGVANTGSTTSAEGIHRTIREQALAGVSISVIGFGMGNYNDVLMEQLAQLGNGNYAYVDDLDEARLLFGERLLSTLQILARDVKIQVEFDPQAVARYRLLGYENRHLESEDFANDRKDAGEVGVGHAVTALYEIKLRTDASNGSLGWLRVRYKDADGGASQLIEKRLPRHIVRAALNDASSPALLSQVAATFAEKLRGSYWTRGVSYQQLLEQHAQLRPQLRQSAKAMELEQLIATTQVLDQRDDRFADLVPIGEMDFDRVPVLR